MKRRPPRSTLFPTTTLSRSSVERWRERLTPAQAALVEDAAGPLLGRFGYRPAPDLAGRRRSEEHTSELQSRQYLVCRLLLEKKKKTHMKSRRGIISRHTILM